MALPQFPRAFSRRQLKAAAVVLIIVILAVAAWAYHTEPGSAKGLDELDALYEDFAREDFPEVVSVDPAELLRQVAEGAEVVFVDEREPKERAVSMLPGAVPAEDVTCCPEKWRGKRLVGYCTVSYRSGLLAKRLAERGIAMENLRGGILGWLHAGGEVVNAAGEKTRKVHIYGPSWNYAPIDYQPVW